MGDKSGIERVGEGWKCVVGSPVKPLQCVGKHCSDEKQLLGALSCVATRVAKECYELQSHRKQHHSKRIDGEWVSMTVHAMGAVIATVLQPVALQWYGLTQRPVVKVLPVSERRIMRQLGYACVSYDETVLSTVGLSRAS
ncbi:hypothetical protein TNCV_1213951 [Trichonephila clavipes]|nr:hypothetical protein TNCV_1213951 [Trichonephila clavipes]